MQQLKYNWNEIQIYYDSGHTVKECKERFGFGSTAMQKAVKAKRFKPRSTADALKLFWKSSKPKYKITSAHSQKLSQHAKNRSLGGKRNSHAVLYHGILLDSSYELRLAKLLDSNNIKWSRPRSLRWVDSDNVSHRYFPDFYLNDFDLYIDTKNEYLIVKDAEKIRLVSTQNNVQVIVVSEHMLTEFESMGA